MMMRNALDRVRPAVTARNPRRDRSSWPSFRGHATGEQKLTLMMDDLRKRLLNPPANRERFHAVFVDRSRALLGEVDLGEGGANALMLRLRPLFARALLLGADGMIMAHNHPSGDCHPSSGDIEATRRIAQVAQSLEIELIDHLIFTQHSVYSMRRGDEL